MEKEAAMEEDPGDYAWLEAEDPVTVSLGPMGSLFQQLRSAIALHYRKLKWIKAKIRNLGHGLEGLCADLKDLSEAEDTITRCWVRQVRDLCYDTSDYLDELMHFIRYSSGTRPRKENRLGSKIVRVSRRPMLLSVPKLKKKLKRVRLIAGLSALVARVEDADERRTRFKISPPQASKHDDAQAQAAGVSHLMPQLPLQLHVDNLIKLLGFDHDHNERKLEVATIFGSAGVGKTAVARTLYHKYREKFQYRAFLRVSRDPDTRRLLADLLSQIKAPPAHACSDVKQLIASIAKHLQGKRYLIVIDDLWDTSTWDIIRRALSDGDYCRIIITTQIEDVALACCNDQLERIYLMTRLNGDQSGISEGGCTEGMQEALKLVYNNFPPHLKTCLLYLNIYPEGWTVKKGELVKQWVAEGFIGSVQGQDAEETAGCYFDALVSTGMVQVVDTNHNDEVLSCTLHHMVLDLIRQESMEENFVTIVNYFQRVIGFPDKVRRLSVQMGGAKGANNILGNMRISQVRSLIFCGFFRSVPSIMEYGILQVLILHIWSDEDRIFDLTTIGELYRLRYLKIECSITVKLPHKIRRLQQLGTLQVDAGLYAVPSDIVHLEKLLHLRLRSESILPHGVGRMTCLRTLGYFDLGCNSEENVRDLGELENLQDLQLTCSAVQPAESLEKNVKLLLGSVLKKLGMLQSVTLVPAADSSDLNTVQDGAGASSMIISCDGSSSVFPAPAHLRRLELSRRCCIFCRLPMWLGELVQLCILKIAVGELSKEDIGILDGLPALSSLSLHVVTASTEKIVFGKKGFSVLRYFKFTCTAPWLKFEEDAMPKLEKLKLCFSLPIRNVIIERLSSGLKEISAIIGCAGVDAGSAWREAILNDKNNPEVLWIGSIYYGDQGRGMETCEVSGEDENNQADIREEGGDALGKIRTIVLLLATLVATVTYQVGVNPPGGVWLENQDKRYNFFFCCNFAAFVASISIPVILMVQIKTLLKPAVLHAAMILGLFGLMGAYIAGSTRTLGTSLYALVLAGAFLVYVTVLHVVKFDDTPSDRGTLDQKNLLLLAILMASVTYQVGLSPPGAFWREGDEMGHAAVSPMLLDVRRYNAFFYCNTTSFMASIALIILLQNEDVYRRCMRFKSLYLCMMTTSMSTADPAEHPEFVDKMRGWLMTVATLFVGIAFQAVIQPPAWMSREPCSSSSKPEKPAFGAPSPAPAATTDKDTSLHAMSASIYFALNVATMAVALTMLVALLTMKKSTSRITLWNVKVMLVTLAIGVAGSFIVATSGIVDVRVTSFSFFGFVIIASVGAFLVYFQ